MSNVCERWTSQRICSMLAPQFSDKCYFSTCQQTGGRSWSALAAGLGGVQTSLGVMGRSGGWCLVHLRRQQERATGKGEIGDFLGELRLLLSVASGRAQAECLLGRMQRVGIYMLRIHKQLQFLEK